jgi:(p)ppGpp synthase/HD superfamily hydrolase
LAPVSGAANPRFEEALVFAVRAHVAVRHERKGTDFPYVAHPIRVAETLDRFGRCDDVVVAGFLHDTIEDAGLTAEQLAAAFGERVAELVVAVSEPEGSRPWQQRKRETIARLENESDEDVLALTAADKLDNVRSIAETLRVFGSRHTWSLFNAPEEEQRWYYKGVARALSGRLPADALTQTLDREIRELFGARG